MTYTCPMDPEILSDKPGQCPKCGMDLVPMKGEGEPQGAEADFKKRFLITLPVTLLTAFIPQQLVLFFLGSLVFVIGGWPFFKAAKGELSHKNPAMMSLVALGILIGFSFSVATTFLFSGRSLYWEISTLISVFLLGHWLEMRAVRGATGALSQLAKLIPPSAHKLSGKDTVDVETASLKVGDKILVKPGEKIPIDGLVLDGESSANEAMITGESKSQTKRRGDLVIGGTLNQDGSLTIEVKKIGEATAIAQITKLVKDAQSSKPNVQLLADRAAGVLFYIALIAGIIAFIYWFPHGFILAATIAVAAIVVACPHALGLAIPTVTTITSTLGAKNGILIKNMKGLEIARKINYVIFDKTGTLTKGEFGVANDVDPKVLALAAAVESKSQHSIAAGIVAEAKKRNLKISEVKNFKSYPGKGAEGVVGGKKVLVGNAALLKIADDSEGKTVVYVKVGDKVAGKILLADIIREESMETIKRLHDMGIKVAMLTGDNQEAADDVGKQLEIDTVFANVLPEDKVNKVKELQNKGNVVAVVGDGVNDAPSLTQAHVGVAIGAGTDVAIESADIVLMKSDPLDVVKATSLSRKTNSKMIQNLAWATGYNVFAIPAAMAGLMRPEWAAILMSASSIIVVFNALLLRKAKLD